MISFKGKHYPNDVILFAVFFYLRYAVSYHDLEEIMQERGVDVDHSTLNRWVIEYAPLLAEEVQKRKAPTSRSWRMDETYIKVRGHWMYQYRAVDKAGNTLDFMLSEQREEAATSTFFVRTINSNGWPDKVVIDKSGANLAGLQNMNELPTADTGVILADRDPSGQISQHYHQAGSSLHQKAATPHEGLQIFSICIRNIGQYRSGPHDPQRPIFNKNPVRISAVCCITASSDSHCCDLAKNLRQNQHKSDSFIS